MIPNNELQAALITDAKSRNSLTDELGGSTEIREDQWQGREFSYPNIRVRMIENTPFMDDCGSRFRVSFLVFTENTSSQNADKIAGIINDIYYGKSFTTNSITFTIGDTRLMPAIRNSNTTWRSEVILVGVASE